MYFCRQPGQYQVFCILLCHPDENQDLVINLQDSGLRQNDNANDKYQKVPGQIIKNKKGCPMDNPIFYKKTLLNLGIDSL